MIDTATAKSLILVPSTSGEQKNRELTSGPARRGRAGQGGPTPKRMMSIKDSECDYDEDGGDHDVCSKRPHQPLCRKDSLYYIFPFLKYSSLWSESLNTVPSLSICSAHT